MEYIKEVYVVKNVIRLAIFSFLIVLIYSTQTLALPCYYKIYDDNNMLIYIDINGIKDCGDYVTVWSKWIPRGDKLKELKKVNDADSLMMYRAYNKYKRQSQPLTSNTYRGSNLVHSQKYEFSYNNYNDLAPLSFDYFIYITLFGE